MTIKVGVAALLVAATLSGCGGSDDPQEKADAAPAGTTIPQAPSQVATTAEEKKKAAAKEKALAKEVSADDSEERAWAKKLCAAISETSDPLTPPNLEAEKVTSIQNSLSRFFTQARKQLTLQVETLNEVGAPPNGRAATEWKQAVGGMQTIETQLGVVQRNVKAAKFKDQKALEKFTAELGNQMQALSNYPGPIAVLTPNPEIGPAIKAEPGCEKLG